MRIILFSVLLSFLIVPGAQGMEKPTKGVGFMLGGYGGLGAGAVMGAPGGPVGMIVGGIAGLCAGGFAGNKIEANGIKKEMLAKAKEEAEKKQKEQAELAEREKYISWERINRAMSAQEEWANFFANPANKAIVEAFEKGRGPLVIGRRTFVDRCAIERNAIESRINQKMVAFRERFGKPVDADTGNFAELEARKAAAQEAIYNPRAGAIEATKSSLDESQFDQLFQDIQQLFITGNLFAGSISNKPIETLKTVMANLRWATANAYCHRIFEKRDKAVADLMEIQGLLQERDRLIEQKKAEVMRIIAERDQEKAAREAAANQNQQMIRDNDALRIEKQRAEGEKNQECIAKENAFNMVQRRDGTIAAAVNQTLEVAESLEELQERFERFKVVSSAATLTAYQQVDELEDENARMRAEIAKLRKDLVLSRDAFASCSFTNKP